MDALELKSVVKRLHPGICPVCGSKLKYSSADVTRGELEKNAMPFSLDEEQNFSYVWCSLCDYESRAIQLGLKIIPVDRIYENDKDWDKKYLEENTLVYGEEGKNPFNKD